jgi:hypothetical protein
MARRIDPDEPTVRTAVFGKQVEDFLQSDIGDYLLQMAKHEELDAIEQLIAAIPTQDVTEIRAKIRTARWFQVWLGEAVQRGLQSLKLLEEDA